MPMKPLELVRLLKKNGFIEVSQRGSHLKMYNPVTKVSIPIPKVSIPIPIHAREMKKGIENAILKRAGLK